jgi:hypothetical protein
VWLFDGVVLPAMVLADALVQHGRRYFPAASSGGRKSLLCFADLAAAARNRVAEQAQLPTVDARELKQQCRAMMRVAQQSSGGGGSGESNNASSPSSASTTPVKKLAAVASSSSGYTEADVEAMRWSFVEIQRSLLETIAEYQTALTREMEEKRLLADATSQIVRAATPQLAVAAGSLTRSQEL